MKSYNIPTPTPAFRVEPAELIAQMPSTYFTTKAEAERAAQNIVRDGYTPIVTETNIIRVGLCAGRHEIPEINGYVYPDPIENPNDFEFLEYIARDFCIAVGNPDSAIPTTVILYVTGLTQALTSFILAANNVGVSHLDLMHYDRDTGDYKPQTMW